jgi:hypothetical protein
MHVNTILEAGGIKDLYLIPPSVLNAVSVIYSALRGVFHRMRMDILWQTWITVRVVAFAPMNAGRAP